MLLSTFADRKRETGAAPSRPDVGPERRSADHCFAAALDEVDYGMLLVGERDLVLHANHAARVELDDDHPLLLLGPTLRARHASDAASLHAALEDATRRGLRKLLTLGDNARRVSVSVVPVGESTALLMLSKRQVCEPLSVQGFARSHGLTPAETRVLVALCQGVPPTEAAVELGVGIATVRSQIGSIRQKTGAQSIRALVRQVAVLPPLMGVLRRGGTARNASHRTDDAGLIAA